MKMRNHIGKSYQEKVLTKEITWDKNKLSEAGKVSGAHCLTDKHMVRESISRHFSKHFSATGKQ